MPTHPQRIPPAAFLRYHALLAQAPPSGAAPAPSPGVWVSTTVLADAGGARRVFDRHLALQGLLLRMEVLGERDALLRNPRLGRLVDERLIRCYVDELDFEALRREHGRSESPLAFVDGWRGWLVVNVERAFDGRCGLRPQPALIASLVLLAEALDAAAQAEGPHAPLLDTARVLVRRSLGDTAALLPAQAERLCSEFGPRRLVRWLLAGTPLPMPMSVSMSSPMPMPMPTPRTTPLSSRPALSR